MLINNQKCRCAAYSLQCNTGGKWLVIRLLRMLLGMLFVLTCSLSAQHS